MFRNLNHIYCWMTWITVVGYNNFWFTFCITDWCDRIIASILSCGIRKRLLWILSLTSFLFSSFGSWMLSRMLLNITAYIVRISFKFNLFMSFLLLFYGQPLVRLYKYFSTVTTATAAITPIMTRFWTSAQLWVAVTATIWVGRVR